MYTDYMNERQEDTTMTEETCTHAEPGYTCENGIAYDENGHWDGYCGCESGQWRREEVEAERDAMDDGWGWE